MDQNMNWNYIRSFNNWSAFCFLSIVSSLALAQAKELPVSELINELQGGGHIIYMRHAKTDHNQRDVGNDRLLSCDKQRNLSEDGRLQAKEIGKVISNLQLPIGEVFTSPYCRCKETAQLTFGKYQIIDDLQFSISKSDEESKFLGDQLKSLMLNTPPTKTNIVFVGHTSNLKEGLGVWPKPEGVLVVFKKVDDEITYKGMIKPNEIRNLK